MELTVTRTYKVVLQPNDVRDITVMTQKQYETLAVEAASLADVGDLEGTLVLTSDGDVYTHADLTQLMSDDIEVKYLVVETGVKFE